MNPSTVLAIETATDLCSVALLKDGQLTVHLNITRPRSHAAHLAPLIREAFDLAKMSPDALDAVAVSMGPGSYTGLRIGVSTAKGLALAVDAPLIGIPSLKALALGAASYAQPGDLILAAFHARRNEVYAAAFRYETPQHLQALAETSALSLDAVADWLPDAGGRRWLLTGNGAEKLIPLFEENAAIAHLVLPEEINQPSAVQVGLLSLHRLEKKETDDVTTFEPFYLKAFVARKNTRSVFERLPF